MNDDTAPHDLLDALVAAYLQAVEAGEVPDREAWLARHPEQADGLRAFFADLDRMDRVAAPLRAEGSDDPTTDIAVRPAAPVRVRYVGDYELLEEIAQGGMGVVYKARQVTLNRVVALKMILQGAFATPRDVARFRAEAEAVANLDHPHIVPIYEVGEHEGLQYFTMRLIEGRHLGKIPRDDARAEVGRLRTIAEAVSFAHRRGILHRDLKPSNVLIDDRGTPYVTDFGLAKRLADPGRSLTETGQFVGTPRYMAPEQAAGRKDLTVAADVYSLGVILYERLAGRPPFTGDDLLTILRQVREESPPPLPLSTPGIDRDLETIVRKTLEKDPTRRYPTADALADDLTRWLNGEPIAARPVGQFERFALWCRRNPVVATLTASVAASLLLGIVASTYFGLNERRERRRAERAEQTMEGYLARGLARPLDPEGSDKGELAVHEVESLWELARLGDTGVGPRFVAEAIRDPLALVQLQARSEPAMIAAVGLDEERRLLVRDQLLRRLDDSTCSPIERTEVALIALGLVDEPGSRATACVAAIRDGLEKASPEVVRERLKSDRTRELLISRVGPAAAATIFVDALRGKIHSYEFWIAYGLAAVAGRMEPGAATRLCSDVVGELVRLRATLAPAPSSGPDEGDRYVRSVLMLPPRLDTEDRLGIGEAAGIEIDELSWRFRLLACGSEPGRNHSSIRGIHRREPLGPRGGRLGVARAASPPADGPGAGRAAQDADRQRPVGLRPRPPTGHRGPGAARISGGVDLAARVAGRWGFLGGEAMKSSLEVRPVGGGDFELVHPRCIAYRELDYEEGMEIWRAGEPEEARDALRYALEGCTDNLWIHVALGRIALEASRDPTLARGHFGYAVELVEKALPPGFRGRLPRDRPANRPFFEAVAGLSACYEALKQPGEAAALRALAARLEGRDGPPPRLKPRHP